MSVGFHLAKDAGFKVITHMMLDLPNVRVERDMEQFKVRIQFVEDWISPRNCGEMVGYKGTDGVKEGGCTPYHAHSQTV